MTPGFTTHPKIEALDGKRVRLLEQLTYRSGKYWYIPKLLRFDYEFVIPKGFVCDLASVPWMFRSLAPSWQRTAGAGVLHDYLFKTGLLSFRDANAIFREALRCPPAVDRVRAFGMWLAVWSPFGWMAWRKHRKAEEIGSTS